MESIAIWSGLWSWAPMHLGDNEQEEEAGGVGENKSDPREAEAELLLLLMGFPCVQPRSSQIGQCFIFCPWSSLDF